MKKVFNYLDYRRYIKDFYEENKDAGLSYRSFAKKAGFNSQVTLMYVIEGKRNLSPASVEKTIKALGLKKKEAEYFRALVSYDQAKTIKKKAEILEDLISNRRTSKIFTMEKDKYEFYSKWYHSVVRELVNIYEVNSSKKVSKLVKPPISESMAKNSLKLLESLGYIVKKADGYYKQTKKLIQTGVVRDSTIINFQMGMLEKGLESLKKISKEKDKMSSSTTLSISKENFELFKYKIRELRKEFMNIASLDKNPEVVYQLSIVLFPLSKEKKGK